MKILTERFCSIPSEQPLNKWVEYESGKAKLRCLNLTPLEYQRAIAALARELKT